MLHLKLTCPFTGIEYEAMESETDGTLIIKHPSSNTLYHYQYDKDLDGYVIPKELMMCHDEMISPIQAAQILGVTRQRMTQIIKHYTIPYVRIQGKTLFNKKAVLKYKENRKVGAPKKE